MYIYEPLLYICSSIILWWERFQNLQNFTSGRYPGSGIIPRDMATNDPYQTNTNSLLQFNAMHSTLWNNGQVVVFIKSLWTQINKQYTYFFMPPVSVNVLARKGTISMRWELKNIFFPWGEGMTTTLTFWDQYEMACIF